ncbi:MAG: hypothetical protein QNJ22_14970 [Desulfosarcinaceae bacterium]|nr:hypothetical protein [Desulfosarcinaceae bacterium]
MGTKAKQVAIQFAYWYGAAADGFWTVVLLHPSFYKGLLGRPELQVDMTLRLLMGIGASLIAGWTVLLIWASRAPIERRAVLLITVLPVLAGLTSVALVGFLSSNMTNAWLVVKCVSLILAMLCAFHLARQAAEKAEDDVDN